MSNKLITKNRLK